MTLQEKIRRKDEYLSNKNKVYCTPKELADILGITDKALRGDLRKVPQAYNAHQDSAGRWIIHKSTDDKQTSRTPNTPNQRTKVASGEKNGTNEKTGLEPWIGENPKVLILGTLPGDESLAKHTYYANSRNAFWKIMRCLLNGNNDADNRDFITSNGIALWDCVHTAERKGSLDSAFNNDTIVPNNIKGLIDKYPTINTIVFNGKRAEKYYKKYCKGICCTCIRLISTSQAATIGFEDKLEQWSIVRDIIRG